MAESKLGTEKIGKLLASLAIPAIAAQIITLLYNLVDRIYIGKMADGTIAMAAVGIVAPIIMIINAFSNMFGRGGAPLASISMGSHDYKKAERYMGNSLSMLLITSVIIMIIVLLFNEEILYLFGARAATMGYAKDYLVTYIFGTIFVQVTVGMNYYITTQGFAKTAMISTSIGGILNIILDPIFIFTLDMGVMGAALATIISQFASFIWVILFIFSKRTILKIRKENLIPDTKILKQIIVLGSSPFFMTGSEGILNICFNNQVLYYGGDIAVSSMTVLFSIMQILSLPVEGLAQGTQPIISYNYGARRLDRVKRTISLARLIAIIYTSSMTILILSLPTLFIGIFNDSQELFSVCVPMLRVYIAGGFVTGIFSIMQQTYNSLGEGKRSLFFATLRKGILLIPLIYILPLITPFGLLAVVLAEPISDIASAIANFFYFNKFIKRKLA